jgi:CDP-diacylglycerol--serine O-phosphatidyltransferase
LAARSDRPSNKHAIERNNGINGGKAVPTVESCALPIVLARDADHNDERRVQRPSSRVHWPRSLERKPEPVDGRYVNTRRKGIYLLPNLLTTGGLFAGFYSIVASIDGNFSAAAWAIFAAMLLDGLDGRVARLTSTASEFGKEFDSLADMVSFGLAPAIVVYQWAVELLEQRIVDGLAESFGTWGRLVWLAAFLYVAAAAFRLARFNSNVAQDRRFFQGLASPAAAAGIASMIWVATSYEIFDGLAALGVGVTITAVTGLLMMSRFAYVSFKDVNPGRRLRFAHLLFIALVFIVIALQPAEMIFALFVVYAASGPAAWLWHRRRAKRPDTVTQ